MNLLNETSKKNLKICLDDNICIRCSLYFVDFNVHSILLKTEKVRKKKKIKKKKKKGNF